MQRTRVKICGITRPEDAIAAANAGADAIGINLYPKARRYVAPEQALRIIAALPPFVTAVGLFVDSPPREVCEVAHSLNLRHVQLHGHESPSDVQELKEFAIVKAVRVSPGLGRELDDWRKQSLPMLRGLLLETDTKDFGGTGIENDWAAIAAFQQQEVFDGLPPIIVAGGLRPETVGDVVRKIRPYAVDVSSGVEGAPNTKSVEKIRRFIDEVKLADGA